MVSEAESSFAAQEINASEKAAAKTLKIFTIHLTGGGNSHNKPPRKSSFLFFSFLLYIIIWSTEKSRYNICLCKPTISSYAKQMEINFRRNGGSEAQN